MKAKDVIRGYYAAWIAGNRDAARSFLRDDLKFSAPEAKFDNADAFMAECWPYAKDFNEMTMIQEVYEDDAAYIVYKFSEFCVGEFHRMRGGKIAQVFVTMNPTI